MLRRDHKIQDYGVKPNSLSPLWRLDDTLCLGRDECSILLITRTDTGGCSVCYNCAPERLWHDPCNGCNRLHRTAFGRSADTGASPGTSLAAPFPSPGVESVVGRQSGFAARFYPGRGKPTSSHDRGTHGVPSGKRSVVGPPPGPGTG